MNLGTSHERGNVAEGVCEQDVKVDILAQEGRGEKRLDKMLNEGGS